MKQGLVVLFLLAASVPAPVGANDFHLFSPAGAVVAEPTLPTLTPDDDVEGFRARVKGDLWSLAQPPSAISGKQWKRLGIGLLAVGAVSAFDNSIRDAVQDRRTTGSTRFAFDARPLGQEGGLALLGITWASGRLFNRPGLTLVAEDGLEATLLAAGLITPALKAISGRARPNQQQGNSSFSPFSDQSFPSGEATEAFAIASVIATHAESKWVKGIAWGLASTVALQRIELDAHWASDVVAGALIGAGVGHWVARRHRQTAEDRPRYTVTPGVGRNNYSLGVTVAW